MDFQEQISKDWPSTQASRCREPHIAGIETQKTRGDEGRDKSEKMQSRLSKTQILKVSESDLTSNPMADVLL